MEGPSSPLTNPNISTPFLYTKKSQIQTFWQKIQDVDLSFINDGFGVMNYKVSTYHGNRGRFKDSFSKTTI